MTALAIVCLATSVACVGQPMTTDGDFAAHVDVFTGTGATGHAHPSASWPFGMIQAGPDTGNAGWQYCSGYQFSDTSVLGYSQTHLSGTGVGDYGDVQILPFTGPLRMLPMRSAIDKSTEVASPGYYSVVQSSDGVRVEIAAAKRSAIYRFTWMRSGTRRVLVNLPSVLGGSMVSLGDGRGRAVDGRVIKGAYRRVKSWAAGRTVAFAIEFDTSWSEIEELVRDRPGYPPRYVVTLPKSDMPVMVKVALSTVDEDAALANMNSAIADWDFERVRTAARAEWNRLLSRSVATGSTTELTNWYTALYHLYLQPNDWADADGRYRGADGKIAVSEDGSYFTTLSLWDTFRAAHPWYTIAVPEIVAPVVRSLLAHYRANGRLPVMSYGGVNVDCMVGNHAVPVIVDAYLKREFKGLEALATVDWNLAFDAVTNTLTVAHPGKPKENWDLYDRYGYFPCDNIRGESASRTLECSYDDWCAAEFARALGRETAYAFFCARAGNWTNVFDRTTGFARGRTSSGGWRDPFDPFAVGEGATRDNDFTEGNAFQYSWHVMHDPMRLVGMMGGLKRFSQRLDELFVSPQTIGKDAPPDVTGLIGQYVHGNEPSHHVIPIYSLIGNPAKAGERITEVFRRFYRPGPDGLCGNDDCGQMSAWYVFSAMGFYPFNPCGGSYVRMPTQFQEVDLHLAGGRSFVVSSRDGVPKDVILRHADIVDPCK